MKRETWRITAIVVALLAAAYYLYPTYQYYYSPPENPDELEQVRQEAINLGLDLQGGIHLVLEVDPSELSENERRDVVDRVLEVIRNRVDEFGVSEPTIHREGEWRIVVELPGVQDVERAKALIDRTAALEFQILEPVAERDAVIDRIESYLQRTHADTSTASSEDELFGESAAQGAPSIRQYLRALGDDIMVPAENLLTVREILESPRVQEIIPSDSEFLWGSRSEELGDGQEYRRLYLVKSRAEMTGDVVADASVSRGQQFENAGQPIVNVATTDEGVKLFSRVTGAHIGERMAIVLDEQVYMAPTIRTKIRDGRCIIEGTASVEEAQDIAIVLRAGALPADAPIVEDRTVGPSLGRDSIEQGKRAALIGLAIVMVFIVLYYGFAGLVADLALGLNLVFVLAILAGFGGTLTLPGIAGIILTIGMAVDANVLIFERIREELRSGKTVLSSIENGYGRAFLTIVDANLTTVITAVVLYQFGTGPIKGFALTLMIGIISSMFTALFVTRTIFEFITTRQSTPKLSIGKLRIFGDTHLDFIRARKVAFVISAVAILVGLGSTIVKGGYNLGIDFAGGTLLELHFDPPVAVSEVRESLGEVSVDGRRMDLRQSEIKQFGSPNDLLIRVEEEAEETHMADGIKQRLRQSFASNIPETDWIRRQEAVGPKIGGELKADAVNAIIVSMILIILYVWWRFKQIQFGVAAVIALLHDVLITLGIFSLLDKEISLAIVAALLTIVGYSLNDTIVIFDRIREDLRLYRRETLAEIINRSINECLNRTVLTSGTTLLVTLTLLFLGGEILADFAFALTIGVIVGTYSSAFVASPVVLVWSQRQEQKAPAKKAATPASTA